MQIELQKVNKEYANVVAIDNMSATFTEGIYGILGANGAGKTTLLNLLTDNTRRDAGAILLDGKEILDLGIHYRRQIGYMPQQQGFYNQMTAASFLYYIAELKELRKSDARAQIDDLLNVTNLTPFRNKRIAGFSGGMRQRLLLAQALLGDPQILFLDEPTAGLDPKERIRIRNYISSISQGKIIFLATHIVSDIELIASQIMILKKGRIIHFGSHGELTNALRGKVKDYEFDADEIDDANSSYSQFQKEFRMSNVFVGNGLLHVRLVGDNLPKSGMQVSDHITLEDVYLYYLGDE